MVFWQSRQNLLRILKLSCLTEEALSMPLFFWFLAQYETKIVGELQLESKPTYRSPYYGLLWIVLQVFTFPNDFPNGWQSFTSFEKLGQFKRWHFYPNNYWHSGISIALWGSCLTPHFLNPLKVENILKGCSWGGLRSGGLKGFTATPAQKFKGLTALVLALLRVLILEL